LLENHLDLQLFHRHARGLAYFSRAIGGLTATGLSGWLTVSAIPSFSTLWLVPRLQGFIRSFPQIQLRVIGSLAALDLTRGEVDIRIPYGRVGTLESRVVH
jgi:DNA-binding transcriptional LysR family regulator